MTTYNCWDNSNGNNVNQIGQYTDNHSTAIDAIYCPMTIKCLLFCPLYCHIHCSDPTGANKLNKKKLVIINFIKIFYLFSMGKTEQSLDFWPTRQFSYSPWVSWSLEQQMGYSVLKSSWLLKYCDAMYIARIDKSPTQIFAGQMASVLLKFFKTFSIFGNCS